MSAEKYDATLAEWAADSVRPCRVDFEYEEKNASSPGSWTGTMRAVRERFHEDSLLLVGLAGGGLADRFDGRFLQREEDAMRVDEGARADPNPTRSVIIVVSEHLYPARAVHGAILLMDDRGDEAREALEPLERAQCVLLCAYLRMRLERKELVAPIPAGD